MFVVCLLCVFEVVTLVVCVPPPSPAEADAVPPPKASGTRANAYMLLYRRTTEGVVEPPVPLALAAEVQAENERFRRLQAAFALKQTMVELEVHWDADSGGEGPLFFDFPQATLLADATDQVCVCRVCVHPPVRSCVCVCVCGCVVRVCLWMCVLI